MPGELRSFSASVAAWLLRPAGAAASTMPEPTGAEVVSDRRSRGARRARDRGARPRKAHRPGVADQLWPDGYYSLVRFTLTWGGGGPRIALAHTGSPADQHEHLSAGWPANYFEPLAKYFA